MIDKSKNFSHLTAVICSIAVLFLIFCILVGSVFGQIQVPFPNRPEEYYATFFYYRYDCDAPFIISLGIPYRSVGPICGGHNCIEVSGKYAYYAEKAVYECTFPVEIDSIFNNLGIGYNQIEKWIIPLSKSDCDRVKEALKGSDYEGSSSSSSSSGKWFSEFMYAALRGDDDAAMMALATGVFGSLLEGAFGSLFDEPQKEQYKDQPNPGSLAAARLLKEKTLPANEAHILLYDNLTKQSEKVEPYRIPDVLDQLHCSACLMGAASNSSSFEEAVFLADQASYAMNGSYLTVGCGDCGLPRFEVPEVPAVQQAKTDSWMNSLNIKIRKRKITKEKREKAEKREKKEIENVKKWTEEVKKIESQIPTISDPQEKEQAKSVLEEARRIQREAEENLQEAKWETDVLRNEEKEDEEDLKIHMETFGN